MSGEETLNTPKQICSIRIMFPVETDLQAMNCKKEIEEVLQHIPAAQTEFSLRRVPNRPIG